MLALYIIKMRSKVNNIVIHKHIITDDIEVEKEEVLKNVSRFYNNEEFIIEDIILEETFNHKGRF